MQLAILWLRPYPSIMTKTITIPGNLISDLGLSEGDSAEALVEVSDGNAVISITSPLKPNNEAKGKRPDFAARINSVFGDKTIESNPILKEREESKW